MAKPTNYLRTYRKLWRLTQGELALLFDLNDSAVARIERGERAISLAVAHTCHLLFDTPLEDLFPAFFAGVEENLYRRLCELRDHLLHQLPTQPVATKLELLHEVIHRLAAEQQSGA